MKVLSDYPEAKMTNEQQNASLGEIFSELVKRLDEGIALIFSFLLLDVPWWTYNILLAVSSRYVN